MASYNKVILMGNLTRDPEMRVTPSGLSICKMGLAVNRSYTTRDGERREEATFVDVDAFDKQAEVIAKYMSKGSPILVEGRLKFDQWESDGQKRSKLSVVLDRFEFVGGPRDGNEGGGFEKSAPPARDSGASASAPKADAPDSLDQDVPF
jgi:single-strand DNA-binding protein